MKGLDKVILLILLLTSLLSGCAKERQAAEKPDFIGSVIERLGSDDKLARLEAGLELIKLSDESNDVIPALYDALKHENKNVRAMAAETLGEISNKFEVDDAPLVEVLNDRESMVRVSAAGAIGLIRDDAKDMVPYLIEGLNDDDADVRLKTLFTFVRFNTPICKGIPEVIPHIINLFEDEETQISRSVQMAVWHFGADAVPYLVEKLDSGKPEIREDVVSTLKLIGVSAKDAAPKLREILADDSDRLRYDAAIALTRIDPENVDSLVPILIEGLESPNEIVLYQSVRALIDIGPKAESAVPALLEVLDRARGFTRADAAYAITLLSEKHFDEGLSVLIEELDSDDPGAQITAITNLGKIGLDAASALPKLRELAQSGEVSIAEAASNAHGKIEGGGTTGTK